MNPQVNECLKCNEVVKVYGNVISSIDISNITGSYYIVVYTAIGGYNDGNSYADAVYNNIYLG